MPVCSYFLRGVCTKDDCPYLHVYVGENAEVCQDFVKGFCPNGDKVASHLKFNICSVISSPPHVLV